MITSPLPSILRAWGAAARLAYRAWPAGAVGRLLVASINSVAQGLIPALALSQVLDASVHREISRAVPWMVLFASAFALAEAAGHLWTFLQRGVIMRTTQAAISAVMAASLDAKGLDHLENPEFADRMEMARVGGRKLGSLVDYLAVLLAELVAVVASLFVLARVYSPLLLPVAMAGSLGLVHASTRRQALAYMDQTIPGQRLARHLVDLGTSAGPAREVRTLGLSSWLLARHRKVADDVVRTMVKAEKGPIRAVALAGAAQSLLLGLGLALVVRETAAGRVSPGQLTLSIVLLRSTMDSASRMAMSIGSDLIHNTHSARQFLWLLDYQPAVRNVQDPKAVPKALRQGISLEDVSFMYPGRTDFSLSGVSLSVEPGTTVALVGQNGAGKSTLVKLLCRFYDPTSGRITVDGEDLRHLDIEEWRRETSGAFQDYMKFCFLAREAVGVGNVDLMEDLRLVEAAAQAAGASTFLARLSAGYETQLGRQFSQGTDLSEGQWQKIALARGLMRSDPLLLVLDEPTASLDARSEQALFKFHSMAMRLGRRRGSIAILVSHRFSTVSVADQIVVLHKGRVVEVGTHVELMKMAGRYAELYGLQAQQYR